MKQDNQRQAVLNSYLAGIIDGEGTIGLSRELRQANWNYTYIARIQVKNTNTRVLEMLKSQFGGGISRSTKRSHNRQETWNWRVNGNKNVVEPLKILLPYLVIKKQQAILLIAFLEKSNWYGYRKWKKETGSKQLPESEIRLREEFYLKIKKLNAVGAAATQ